MTAYERIFEFVSSLKIVDTHEHLPDRPERRDRPTDVLREYLLHYFDKDLISAGMPEKTLEAVRDSGSPLMERWLAVEPWWQLAGNTGYCRALELAAKGLHGVDGIRRDTIEALDASFQKSLDDPNWFRTVLQDRCNIAVSILDYWADYKTAPPCDSLFRPVWRIDGHVLQQDAGGTIAHLQERNGMCVRSFGDYLELIDADIALSARLGYIGFKLGLAYQRSLRFDRGGYGEASEQFEQMMAGYTGKLWSGSASQAPKALQDYCLHRCLRAIERTGLPLQVHTGLQEGNGNQWGHSDPMLLNNLFGQYPDLKFDLFHIGYPNWMALAALAKNFPNVYIDMCWAHIISPEASVNALMEYLDSVPSNKISAFGGDYLFVDGVYGHQLLARRNVSRALANKVEQGVFDEDMARVLARRLLVENPAALFQLNL